MLARQLMLLFLHWPVDLCLAVWLVLMTSWTGQLCHHTVYATCVAYAAVYMHADCDRHLPSIDTRKLMCKLIWCKLYHRQNAICGP